VAAHCARRGSRQVSPRSSVLSGCELPPAGPPRISLSVGDWAGLDAMKRRVNGGARGSSSATSACLRRYFGDFSSAVGCTGGL